MTWTLTVNRQSYRVPEDKRLIDFLRDDLGLTSVKDGCSEGTCGTCSVIADGKLVKSCIMSVSRFDGSSITTVEGLTPREKEVYVHTFAECGAVQCGFCTPGMVMAAKALLDQNPDPTRQEIKKAITGNLCRCTGYKKIIDAIGLAARFLREDEIIPAADKEIRVGDRSPRIDVMEKVLGTGKFPDDYRFDDMIYGRALRTPYPRARVNRIDVSKALKHPDCVAVLTAADVPNNTIGHIVRDWDVMIAEGEVTRYIGDSVALVATGKRENLQEVLDLIEVDYTELEPILDPFEAMKDGAPQIHEKGNILSSERLIRGDAHEAITGAAHVVTETYRVSWQEHAFLEPECAIGWPSEDGGVHLITASQSIYDEQREVSEMLGIEPERVHVQSALVGGAFGGREDMSVQHHAALLAWKTGRRVNVRLSRYESTIVHTKRHPMTMKMTTSCDADGRVTALVAEIVADTGAYASLGGPVTQRACTHAAGPYNFQNIDISGKAVYTNNVVSGAFRGFGVTQSCYAMECNLNLLAQKCGMDPWEFRYLNVVRPGDVLPNGQVVDPSCGLAECLEAVKEAYQSSPYAGIACSFKNSGLGVGVPDFGRCTLSVEKGKIHIRTSAACSGQGVAQVVTSIVCQTLDCEVTETVFEMPNTDRTPDAGTSTASRQTLFTGEAARQAAQDLKTALDAVGRDLSKMEGMEFFGEFGPPTDPLGSSKEHPVSHIGYSYGCEVAIPDEKGEIQKMVGAYDVGTPVNVTAVEGQIEGGCVMGLGYALTEEFVNPDGIPKFKLGTYGLFRANRIPEIETHIVKGPGYVDVAYGARGIGELACIPIAPSVAHAYFRLDGRMRTSLPMEDTFYRKKKV